ncbi:MAG: hypothetical protein ABL971_05365 [Vicinamibacterales bacterium]
MAKEISLSAYRRLLLLHDQEIASAKTIAARDCYADFLIETPGGSFQEAFAGPDSKSRPELGKDRAARRAAWRERIPAADAGTFNEFFTDGPPDDVPPPFYESWKEAVEGRPTTEDLLRDPAARARALSHLGVIQAYLRMRERSK